MENKKKKRSPMGRVKRAVRKATGVKTTDVVNSSPKGVAKTLKSVV
jgi:hypothetical protein